jgi:hypothetical protein
MRRRPSHALARFAGTRTRRMITRPMRASSLIQTIGAGAPVKNTRGASTKAAATGAVRSGWNGRLAKIGTSSLTESPLISVECARPASCRPGSTIWRALVGRMRPVDSGVKRAATRSCSDRGEASRWNGPGSHRLIVVVSMQPRFQKICTRGPS